MHFETPLLYVIELDNKCYKFCDGPNQDE